MIQVRECSHNARYATLNQTNCSRKQNDVDLNAIIRPTPEDRFVTIQRNYTYADAFILYFYFEFS